MNLVEMFVHMVVLLWCLSCDWRERCNFLLVQSPHSGEFSLGQKRSRQGKGERREFPNRTKCSQCSSIVVAPLENWKAGSSEAIDIYWFCENAFSPPPIPLSSVPSSSKAAEGSSNKCKMNLKLGSPLLSFSYNERPERTVIGLTNRLSIHKNQRPGKLLTVVAPIKTVMYN